MDAGLDPAGTGVSPAPSASRFIAVGGLRLHCLDYGTAGHPPMLCLHGGAAHAHWFDFVAPGFTADRHVLALDQRGHGESAWADPPAYSYEHYVSDLAGVVESLDLRDFVLIGHSMGGGVALMYAAMHPGRVAKLVVADSMLRMSEERVAALREVGSREGRSYATREEFLANFRLRPTGSTASPAIIRHLAEHGGRRFPDGRWRHRFDRNVYARREAIDTLPYWSRIRVPALIVKGELSLRITPELFAEVRARCPQVGLAEIPNSDHHVTLDNPGAFIRAVKAFLET
jgi:pimeloyl-ACP methyl ester carboxylesterase